MPALHTFKKQTCQTTVPYHIILKQHASKRPGHKKLSTVSLGGPFPTSDLMYLLHMRHWWELRLATCISVVGIRCHRHSIRTGMKLLHSLSSLVSQERLWWCRAANWSFSMFFVFFSRSKRTWLEQTENSSWTNINLCHSPTYLYSLGNLGI